MGAVGSASHECVRFLLRQYKKQSLFHINSATDSKGRTALMCAVKKFDVYCSVKMVQWILEAGADATKFFNTQTDRVL